MANFTFGQDTFVRKILRYLVYIQVGAVPIIFSLILFKLDFLSFLFSFATFVLSILVFLWLYLRYQKNPYVQAKRNIQENINTLQIKISHETKKIQSAQSKRKELQEKQQVEHHSTLQNLQQKHIQDGLASAHIMDAKISGIGPKLKERLSAHGYVSAAHINSRISQISGFGEAKYQALKSWASSISARLNSTKPNELPIEISETISQKYRGLHNENDSVEKTSQFKKIEHQDELSTLSHTLKQYSSITFLSYLNKSFASKGITAGLIAGLLVVTQSISGISATTSTIIASIPTATMTLTASATPTLTFTPTLTLTATITSTPTITDTPTITFTPTETFTPTQTFTPRPTNTLIPTKTFTAAPVIDPLQNVTAICNDGTYSYSAHRQGTCSHHGGVKQWIHRPPN